MISERCFYISIISNILLEEIHRFSMVWPGLEKYHPGKKEYFWQIWKTGWRVFLNKLWLTSERTHIKIEMPSKPLIYHKIEEYKRFLAACGALRGASLSTFEIFDVAKGQKRAFCSFDYWELSKDFLRYFQKSTWFYLPTTKDNLMGRVWGKTFLWCERTWTTLTEIAT